MSKQQPDESRPRQSTETTPWLIGILAVITVVFVFGQLAGIEPLIKAFRWLAIIL